MTIVTDKRGQTVRTSRNLRGMIDHGRRAAPVAACYSWPDGLAVTYDNGDTARSPYASPEVAGRFLNSRRSWPRLAASGDAVFVATYLSGAVL